MSEFDDLARLDATAQAELVRRREVQPIELVDAAIDRIDRLNPQLNAVVTPMYAQARAAAQGDLPDGPFRGVPYLLKDLTVAYKGVPLSGGAAVLKDFVPKYDAELVTRLKAAGLVIVGKTNTPEFGLVPTTEPHLFGPARNPWDPERIAGGSSGGAAVAVAAGMVPAAHGSDGGGSIRIPASCCGLFGLKPTRARLPRGPVVGEGVGSLSVDHALTWSVRDSAALLDATAGPDVGVPFWAPPPPRPFLQEVGADPGRLRIAMTTEGLIPVEIHPDCIEAVKRAADLCASLGHVVEEAALPIDNPGKVAEQFTVLWVSGVAWTINMLALENPKVAQAANFEPLTWGLYEMGKPLSASELMSAQQGLQLLSRRIGAFFLNYDLLLTPVLAEPPLPLGQFDSPPDNPLMGFMRASEYVPFTPLANITGQPAMSVPLHWNEQGLPIGAHFMGRYGDEATLLRLAAQLEQAQPWAQRRPPVSA